MKRHKNLERAIVLGLILSTGIYGTAFAERIWGENLDKVVEKGDLEVNDSRTAVGFDGKIDVKNGNLIITAGSNGIESGHVSEAQLNILANGVEIKSNKNGIFTATEEGHSGKVIIGSEEKKIDYLRIDSKGQGIDNKSGEVKIYGNEDSNIIIHSTGSQGVSDDIKSAINNGKDIVEISGGNISLIADNGHGIVNDAKETSINSNTTQITASRNGIENKKGDTSIKGKDVRIKAGKNAVHNSGTGTINIMYPENTQEDISTLDNQSKYNVILIGEEKNGILSDGAGTINVKAYDDTIITGKENGILSNKNGQINVTAGNNNYIGQYTDEKGKEYTSQTGINVSSGTVTITSGNENNIYGTKNGIYATGENSTIDIDGKRNNIVVKNNSNGELNGIHVKDNATVNIGKKDTGKLNSLDINVSGINKNGYIYGVKVDKTGNFYVEADTIDIISGIKDKNMSTETDEKTATNIGIYSAGKVDVSAKKDIVVSAYSDGNNYGNDAAIQTENGTVTINGDGNLTLDVKSGVNENSGIGNSTAMGIYTLGVDSVTDIEVKKGVNINVDGAGAIGINANYGQVNITATDGIYFNVISNNSSESNAWGAAAEGIMIYNYGDSEKDTIVSLNTENDIQINITNNNLHKNLNEGASVYGIAVCGSNSNGMTIGDLSGNNISIVATNNSVTSNEDRDESVGILVQDSNDSRFIGTAKQDFLVAVNSVESNSYGIQTAQGNVDIYAEESIIVESNSDKKDAYGIYAGGNAPNYPGEEDTQNIVSLRSKNNTLLAGCLNEQGFGSGHAIQAENASDVDLNAIDGDNSVSGVIYAKGDSTKVNLTHKISEQDKSKGNNIILSSAHGSLDNIGDREKVVAAIYAQSNGEVNIVAGKDGYNYIATDATLTNDKDREHTVWAQHGGKINIEGKTFIIAENSDKNTDIVGGDGHEQEGNSIGIAIAAGTGTITDGNGNILDEYKDKDGSLADRTDEERSKVELNYKGDKNGLNSYIKGDIVSGYGGLIDIKKVNDTTGGIDIQGNGLVANGGKLNIDLGNGGTWIGRADDYGDAGYGEDAKYHQNFYNPAFSNEIIEGGTVTLKMGDNSTWYVNGQSWITNVNTEEANNATIDLVKANTDKNETAHALTIHNLKGNANINMSLDGNREISDMIYIKKAEGEYNIVLADAVTTGDIYANGLNGLRFATVGAGSNVKFRAGTYDKGFFNVEYEVGSDKYQGNKENGIYNGEEFDGEQGKVGNDEVDKFFEEKQDNTEDIALDKSKVTVQNEINETTNYKLVGRKGEDISDAGKTIINMSRANYDQAVYMDNLNKRLGEARYLDGDEGLWIRMRHDKIDKDNGYEINNNMYELGYDKKYDSKSKNGYHKRGVAIDYMNGDTSYDNIGSGETNRKGLWLYDTWIGNKGHYTDYVAKWGHLENSFDLYTKTAGEKVLGKYNNDVYSLSAEWGYKDQLNNDWYIEPQMQLQYAKVTGADYKTSQGTQVSLDGIDSLIARAGFRLGKDFGEKQKSTVYLKADILHEFLGDQDILVRDKTTDGNILTTGYDNNGTWYTVGLGFSTMLSDNSYAFLDVEKLFGNDHNNSYQINGGFNWLL